MGRVHGRRAVMAGKVKIKRSGREDSSAGKATAQVGGLTADDLAGVEMEEKVIGEGDHGGESCGWTLSWGSYDASRNNE